jgi:hypothetical protein
MPNLLASSLWFYERQKLMYLLSWKKWPCLVVVVVDAVSNLILCCDPLTYVVQVDIVAGDVGEVGVGVTVQMGPMAMVMVTMIAMGLEVSGGEALGADWTNHLDI